MDASYPSKNMVNLIPGFSIIKTKVITPLLVATEKVVDQLLSEGSSSKRFKTKSNGGSDNASDDPSTAESKSVQDKMQNLNISKQETISVGKKRRYT